MGGGGRGQPPPLAPSRTHTLFHWAAVALQPGLHVQPSPHEQPPSPAQQSSPPAQQPPAAAFFAHAHVSHAHVAPHSQQHLHSLAFPAGQEQPSLQPQDDMVGWLGLGGRGGSCGERGWVEEEAAVERGGGVVSQGATARRLSTVVVFFGRPAPFWGTGQPRDLAVAAPIGRARLPTTCPGGCRARAPTVGGQRRGCVSLACLATQSPDGGMPACVSPPGGGASSHAQLPTRPRRARASAAGQIRGRVAAVEACVRREAGLSRRCLLTLLSDVRKRV
jgi:hypothetical protein